MTVNTSNEVGGMTRCNNYYACRDVLRSARKKNGHTSQIAEIVTAFLSSTFLKMTPVISDKLHETLNNDRGKSCLCNYRIFHVLLIIMILFIFGVRWDSSRNQERVH